MTTETVLITARLAVDTVLNNEIITFLILGLAFILFVCGWCYLIRRWSWLPRKHHGRVFNEKF